MGNIEKSLKWMSDHHRSKGNYPYSMIRRYGNPGFDCSSAVYYALIAGGFLPKGYRIGNTETLYKEPCLKEISYKDVRRGDIFIQGVQGKTLGAGGHTGFFTRKGEIIHCNYTNNGISTNNENEGYWYFLDSSYRPIRYFRPISGKEEKKASKPKKSTSYRKIKNERWTATCLADINVRALPSTSSEIVAMYKKGQKVHYDSVYEGDGYRWISYIGGSGKRRYMAYRPLLNKNDSWMKF